MVRSKKIVIGAACLVVAGVAGFGVTAWAAGGLASDCRFRLRATARVDCYERFFNARLATHGVVDKADPLYPCSIMEERYLRACFEIQTAVILYLNHGDIGAAARTCDTAVIEMRDDCYRSLGPDITSYALRDAGKTAALCAKGSVTYQPACYVGAAKALLDWAANTDTALEFCAIVAPGSRAGRDACYQAVGEQIAALSSSPDWRAAECDRAGTRSAIAACRRGAQL